MFLSSRLVLDYFGTISVTLEENHNEMLIEHYRYLVLVPGIRSTAESSTIMEYNVLRVQGNKEAMMQSTTLNSNSLIEPNPPSCGIGDRTTVHQKGKTR